MATYARGFLVKDATGMILVYQGSTPTAAAGDVVTVEGTTSAYGGAMQFGNTAVITKTGTATVEHGTPEEVTGAKADEMLASFSAKYITYEGTLSLSTNSSGTTTYYNITLDGATTAIGSIQYPVDDIATFNGKLIKVTGYWIGISSSKYINTMMVSVEEVSVGGDDNSSSDDPIVDSSSSDEPVVDSSSSEDVGGDEVTLPEAITAAPVVGASYQLFMYQVTNKEVYYLTGAMDGYYYATSTDSASAVTVFVEAVEGKDAFYLCFNKDNTKNYIGLSNVYSGNKWRQNVIFATSPVAPSNAFAAAFEWAWDADRGILTATYAAKSGSSQDVEAADVTLYLGTYGTFNTISASTIDHFTGTDTCLAKLTLIADAPVAPHEHSYEAVVTAPTCTVDGYTTYTCAGCGDSYTDNVVTAEGHKYFYPCDPVCCVCYEISNPNATHTVVHVEAKAATCTAMGNVEYWYCSDCGATWLDEAQTQVTNQMNIKVPMVDHEYFYACDKVCMNCYEETNPNATHTVVHVEAKAATCTEMGNVEYWYCSDCGSAWLDEEQTMMTNQKSVIIPNSDHSYNEGVQTMDPTLNSTGLITYTCGNCGESYSEEIPMLSGAASVNGVNFATLAEAIAAAQAGETVTLTDNVNVSEIIVLDKAIVLDGGDKTITSTALRAINVDCVGDVVIKNVTVVAATGCERGINIIGNPSNLTLENVTVNGGYYGINFASSANGANVTVKNSEISSWGAINVNGDDHDVVVENSTLIGTNTYSTTTNSFGVIALACSNSSITVNGGTIKAIAKGTEYQWIVSGNSGAYSNTTVTINAQLTLEGDTAAYCGAVDFTTNSVKFPVAYAEALKAEGFCAVADEANVYVTLGAHTYDFVVTDPTCAVAGFTTYTCAACGDSYTEAGEAATGAHEDGNNDYKCDTCSKVMEPADGEVLTIPQAIALAKALGTNKYSTNKYYMTVIVENIYNTTYGNANVTDAEGNKYVFYGLYLDGVRYDKLTYKPVKGDELTVYGAVGSYSKDGSSISYQIQNAEIDDIVAHEHEYTSVVTDPTCLVAGYTTYTCSICDDTYTDNETDATGHTMVDGVCSVCGAEEGSTSTTITASKTMKELIVSEGWTDSTTKQSFALDDVVSVKINGGSNTGKAYNGDHIRIYATDSPAGTITISVAEGYELVSVKISAVTGTYAFLYVDGTTTDICNKVTAVSGSSVVLNSVKNGSNGKQVRVTAIEVVYKTV